MADKNFYGNDRPIQFNVLVQAHWDERQNAYVGYARWSSLEHTHNVTMASPRPTVSNVLIGEYTPRFRQPTWVDKEMQTRGLPADAIEYLKQCFVEVIGLIPTPE